MTTRALVLGGGGALGIAWETGVLAGLAEHGVDLRDADLVVGTSAGAVVAAQLTAGLDLEELYAAQLSPVDGEAAPKTSPFALFGLVWRLTRARDARDFGVRMGRYALAADTGPESERREWLAGVLSGVSHARPRSPGPGRGERQGQGRRGGRRRSRGVARLRSYRDGGARPIGPWGSGGPSRQPRVIWSPT
ncbi:patatin-like phospholipase family protein [Nonomuraea sp. LPB2021202275-12-8]|uniref:patatin-like phospholipase family protein n=1 Tax=Nonomuraea sp. LPB2021202275-12-8 TaxID=3120159 RepID=UPI00300C6983